MNTGGTNIAKRSRSDSGGVESSTGLPIVREAIKLPVQAILSRTTSEILTHLGQLNGDTDKNSEYKYPIVIGSHAAAFWLPSFRPCADWDLIATPQQAINMINSLQDIETKKKLVDINLIYQPLDRNVIRRRPVTTNVQEKIDVLPSGLYKVIGEIEGAFKFEIEITPTSDDNIGSILESSSTGQLFKICNTDDLAYTKFPIGSNKGHQCIVAPIEVLEALKCSHIYWPAYFSKHIADIHTIRAVLATPDQDSSFVNIGFRADKNKPLTSPSRTPELQIFLLTRTLETEAFRGTPGAHINLNVSNEDFLGRDDDLFVTRYIPHDSVHDMVKYGDIPIYDQLKTDKSKAMVSRDLFEKAPYDKQLKCVKEEAMVIALERFLLPNLSSDPSSAYKSALIRICTTLTKGWFREFAINNFPRLAICDMELLPIRDKILNDHPLPPRNRHDPLDILKHIVTNLEELVTVQKLIPLAESVNITEVRQYITNTKAKRRRTSSDDDSGDDDDSDDDDSDDDDEEESRYYGGDEREIDHELNLWIINSCIEDHPPLLTSFSNNSYYNGDCNPSITYYSTICVQPLNEDTNLRDLSEYKYSHSEYEVCQTPSCTSSKMSVYVAATTSGGSWGGEDIWSNEEVNCNSLSNELKILGLDNLTEDLLWAFIIALVQPKLFSSGETPLINHIIKKKSEGLIPLKPVNPPWYDLWKYDII